MDNRTKDIFAAWVQAIGTVLSAIGSTPFENISEEKLLALNLWGNELQASGNALAADAEEKFTLNKFGNQIQSIGNLVVISGIIIEFNEVKKQLLDIQGNLLQALGGGTALGDVFNKDPSIELAYSLYGNLLQVIGNSLQAISGTLELKGQEATKLNVVGSWIQAIGSVISALGTTKY
ncbi:DUF6944 family repetitive protein [Bacillus sp. 2205SS5-2]|uniref:DUF6944 family repetitive protein n=1 Tax=Bacillus sp. 2205SS5-2 TaxID=3109031 RepID=UPI0030076ACD